MKQTTISRELMVGLFALVALLILIYMSMEVNNRGSVGGKGKAYFARFDSVSGLVPRTPIEVAGIITGYIDKITLDHDKARVDLVIGNQITVYRNAQLHIKDRGILGDKYVQLRPGTSDHGVIAEGQEIPNTYSGGGQFDDMSEALSQTTNIIKELLQSDNPQGALGQTIVNLRDATGNLNTLVSENQRKISDILENLSSFSADIRDVVTENREDLNTMILALTDVANSLKATVGSDGHVALAAERIHATVTSLQNVIDRVERGEGTVGRLLKDESTVDKLNDALDGVNETVGLFRRVQLGVRYRGEFLTSDSKMQNLVGLSLWPSPDKFLLLELVDAPVGETRVTDTSVSSGGTEISSIRTVQTNDRLLFNVQLGKRFWDAVLRVGMMRNKGGVGLDYNFFRDRLVVTADAFDFSRINDRLHLRTYGTLFLYKHFLLTGGFDDLLSQHSRRNAFVGAGVHFTDHDFKALLPALGSGF